jgi:DnaJ like chaperone protein
LHEEQERQRRQSEERRRKQDEAQGTAKAPNELPHAPWWQVLGVHAAAPLNEVRRCYRAKVRQYHPDRVQGLGPEIVAVAEHHTKELNAAFAKASAIHRTMQALP